MRINVIKYFKKQVEEFIKVMEKTPGHRFYSASLLLVYDAKQVDKLLEEEKSGSQSDTEPLARFKLIDFANNTYDQNNLQPDDDILKAAINLLALLNELLENPNIEPKVWVSNNYELNMVLF